MSCIAVLSALTVSATVALSRSSPALSSGNEFPAHKTLRVALDDNYPPYIFRNPAGDIEGLLPDLWRMWSERTGIKVELLAGDWALALPRLDRGEVDVVDTVFRNATRDKKYDFTTPYADIPVSIFADKNIGAVVDLRTLQGFLVGAKAGDICIEYLNKAGITTVELYPSFQGLVTAAAEGKVKTFCLDDPPAYYLLYRHGIHRDFRNAFTLFEGQFHRAVRKGDAATRSLVENGFNAIPPALVQQAKERWLGVPLSTPPYFRQLAYAAGLVAVIGLIAGTWAWGLRREVRRRTAELNDERTHLRTLVDTLPDLVWLKDANGVYLSCNTPVEVTAGIPRDAIIGKTDLALVGPELADSFHASDIAAMAAGAPCFSEQVYTNSETGRRYILEVIKTPMVDSGGRLIGVLGIGRDVTERRRHEERLRLSAQVFESTADGIVISDAEGRVVAINRAFSEITGYREEQALGQNAWSLLGGEIGSGPPPWDGQPLWRGELVGRRANGETFPLWLTVSPARDPKGTLTHEVVVFSDITSVKKSQNALNFLAHHDPLTRLPNRTLLLKRLDECLKAGANGDAAAEFSLLFVDLDGFKHINDSLGHSVGDRLLKAAAERLTGCVGAEDLVARLGGDEFVVLVADDQGGSRGGDVALHLNHAFNTPLPVDGRVLYITASIGMAHFPDHGRDVDSLLKHADLAMYRAKAAGRNTLQVYDDSMGEAAVHRQVVEGALREALNRGEFFLHYQPQFRLHDLTLVGVEALLRWRHPELGPIGPDQFIPMAEENGAILSIGAWVLEEACRQLAEWRRDGVPVPQVAVNLSAHQLEHDDIGGKLKNLMSRYQLQPKDIELEITETLVMNQSPASRDVLNRVFEANVPVAIDDFGTGYSSLGRLKALPAHRLKIDRSFVGDIGTDGADEAIIRAIVALGHSLGLEIVAEGVETPAQAEFLLAVGCDTAQGYLYAKPLSAEAMATMARGFDAWRAAWHSNAWTNQGQDI